MGTQPTWLPMVYAHDVLEGSAYDVGRLQGERLKQSPALAQFFAAPPPGGSPLTPRQAETALRFFDRHCPGLNEEIRGCAEALGAPPEQLVYYAFTYQSDGQCSHLAVLPPASPEGHVRVARSYEFHPGQSDLRLATTRVAGHYAHMGFSEILFGRDDGLNERGLCVTMSAGAPRASTEPGGCMFWALVRTVLDRCATVDEALEVVQSIPVSFNLNLLLADRTGQAALVEIACSHRAVKRIGPETSDQYLIATNHYTLPTMQAWDTGRMWNSVARYQAVERRLRAAWPAVTPEVLRSLLSAPYPTGVCCHYYSDYLGTLWSEVFDVTAGTVEVCFGAPDSAPSGAPLAGLWRTFDLHSPAGFADYPVQLPDTPADPALWRKLNPGAQQ